MKWWMVKAGDDEGFAARYNFVKRYYRHDYEKEPWYFGNMSQMDAEEFLRNQANSDGSFLVRHDSTIGKKVLSLKYFDLDQELEQKYAHHPIETASDSESVWITKDPDNAGKYKNLNEMIEAHRETQRRGLQTRLTSVCVIPCPHTDPSFEHYNEEYNSYQVPQHQIQTERGISSKRSGLVEKARLRGFIDVVVKPLNFQCEEDGLKELGHFFQQMCDLRNLDHPNIVQLFGYTTNVKNKKFLIPGMMAKGDLKSQLQKMWTRGDRQIADRLLFWAVEVTRGMQKLASLNIVHGDLAAR